MATTSVTTWNSARPSVALLAALMVHLTAVSSAHADVTLHWDAPAECLDQQAFERAFARTMGASLASMSATETEVSVALERVPEGFHVHVQVASQGVSRTRELSTRGRSCHRLDEGLLVVVGLLIDEVSVEVETHPIALPEVAPSVDVAPLSPPPTTEEEPSPLPVASAPSDAIQGAWTLGARARYESLPGLVGGVVASAELRLHPLVRLGLGVDLYPETSIMDADGAGASIAALAPALTLTCLAPVLSWMELGASATVDVLLVEAHGIGLDVSRTARGLSLDVLVEARANLELVSWLWLRVTAGIGIVPLRSRVVFEEGAIERTLYTTSIVFPTASLGLELRFGS